MKDQVKNVLTMSLSQHEGKPGQAGVSRDQGRKSNYSNCSIKSRRSLRADSNIGRGDADDLDAEEEDGRYVIDGSLRGQKNYNEHENNHTQPGGVANGKERKRKKLISKTPGAKSLIPKTSIGHHTG